MRLAEKGADIIAVDVCEQLDGVSFPMSTPADIAAKHGVVGLMRPLAVELGHHGIRVNTLRPSQVNTPMVMHEGTYRMFRPDLGNPTADDFAAVSQDMHVLPTPWVEPVDVSNTVVYLASDEGRYLTGVTLPVDAGALIK